MKSSFTISEVFTVAWKKFKENFWILVGLLIGYTILFATLVFFAMPMVESKIAITIVYILALIFSLIFYLGYAKNCFQALDNIEPQFSAYGQQAVKLFNALVAGLIFALIISIGLVFFIIPGFYLALRFQFYFTFIVEENSGAIQSLKNSWKLTKKNVMPLFLLLLVMFCICLLGIIFFGIGIFITTPLVYVMYCYTFRKLNSPLNALDELKEV